MDRQVRGPLVIHWCKWNQEVERQLGQSSCIDKIRVPFSIFPLGAFASQGDMLPAQDCKGVV